MSSLLNPNSDKDPRNELIEDQAIVTRNLIIFITYYSSLLIMITTFRFMMFETNSNVKDGHVTALEMAFYVTQIIKLITDCVMLVLFVMEFKILTKLMTSFVKEQLKNRKNPPVEITAQLKKQNLFVSDLPILM